MNESLMVNSVSAASIAEPVGAVFRQGRFFNRQQTEVGSLAKTLRILWRFIREPAARRLPQQALPMQSLTAAQLAALSNDQIHVIKLGHSSMLLKVHGEYWLIDPVFGQRASPFSWLGPKRFQPTPIAIEQLPTIDKVLISHDHYDHLDRYAIAKLRAKTRQFLVPLGVEQRLMDWGVPTQQIARFDWWQSRQFGAHRFTFTPSQHFSGRGLRDGNSTLWGSWVMETPSGKLFFSGDSGYFPGFAEIGRRFGPFALTMMENGAYDQDWHDIHMTPEQSVAAHLDLQGQVMMPVHNGTFDLAFHHWREPLERVAAEAQALQVTLSTPVVGEVVTVSAPFASQPWWQDLAPVAR